MMCRVLIVIISLSVNVSSEGSIILKTIGNYLPNLTEIGFLTNIVNVYCQVSGFVRATNSEIKNLRQINDDVQFAERELRSMYNTVKSFKSFDLYDMYTWRSTVRQLNYLIDDQIGDLVGIFSMLEYHTVESAIHYLDDIDDISQFDIRRKEIDTKIEHYFYGSYYQNQVLSFDMSKKQYLAMTIHNLERQFEIKQEECLHTGGYFCQDELNAIQSRLHKMYSLMSTTTSDFERIQRHKMDTILSESKSLITSNLVEIQAMEHSVKRFEEKTSELVALYERLKNDQVPLRSNEMKQLTSFVIFDTLYGNHPNKVPIPSAPDSLEGLLETPSRKVVSHHDILSLENQINFMLLQQESLLRDIAAMKANTMSFIQAYEALRQEAEISKLIAQSTHVLSYVNYLDELTK